MKKKLPYLCSLLLWVSSISAQCNEFQDNLITLTSQAEVEEFCDMYMFCDTISANIIIEEEDLNDPIITLESFNFLKVLNGDLRITSNPDLLSTNGFEQLTEVNGVMIVRDNDLLEKVVGFGSLVKTDTIIISRNDQLIEIDQFKNLDSLGTFLLISCERIREVSSLNNLTVANDHVSFSHCDSLTDLFILDKLTRTNRFTLSGCTELCSISDLDFDVRYNIVIDDTKLERISGFESVNSLTERLRICDNRVLKEIDGFKNLEKVSQLNIDRNNALTGDSVNNFTALDSVMDLLTVTRNYRLEHLGFIQNLSYVGNEVRIIGNEMLNSLDGLWGMAGNVPGEYRVFDNTNLVDCDALCEHLNQGREITLENNMGYCNSVDELIEHCSTVSNNSLSERNIKIFPNPVEGEIVIDHGISGLFEIYDSQGALCLKGEIQQNISCEQLAPGVYFLLLISSDGQQILKKFCKR